MRKRMSGKCSSAPLHHGRSGRRWSLIGEINNSSAIVMMSRVLHLVTSAVKAQLKISPIYHALAALDPPVREQRSDSLHFIIWDKPAVKPETSNWAYIIRSFYTAGLWFPACTVVQITHANYCFNVNCVLVVLCLLALKEYCGLSHDSSLSVW